MAAVPAAGTPAAAAAGKTDQGKSTSKTVTDTIIGEHEHTIVGYSLNKGIGDGEPIASERFMVGGHEWVLLFYPDGKRSSSTEVPNVPGGIGPNMAAQPAPVLPAGVAPAPAGQAGLAYIPNGGAPAGAAYVPPPAAAAGQRPQMVPAVVGAPPNPPVMGYPQQGAAPQPPQQQQMVPQQVQQIQQVQQQHGPRRETNEYAALFVALIGESDSPLGVVNTSDGRVVRAFHRFTLVDQTGQGRDLTKGRRRDQGAVKISCARQDPNARNCHGYRKFVKRSVLENNQTGFLVNDTIIIKYTIELVVSSGGALSRVGGGAASAPKLPIIQVPPPNLGKDMAALLEDGHGSDVKFKVEGEEMAAHRIVLTSRSPVFQALLNAPMREHSEGIVDIQDVRAPVFRALLHFTYTDSLPEELEGTSLDVPMAQHLLVAADRFQLHRLRRICERRLCETVEVDTVATTLALAEQNHGEELKRVCLDFVSRNLQAVMVSEGYLHMVSSCPQLQAELLRTIAVSNTDRTHGRDRERARHHGNVHPRDGPPDASGDEHARRVKARRE
ncbi:hypothetical protein WJX72_003308 [[Myrmecia] bisecta]|uniref:BTB domain-containing protein n=1 Tax=[Myrmecia] bisecta TaxID=41462 RepID=A0AAW1Q2U4_9CHLO